ncbi:hypothetical protein ACFQU7_41225 [Pseudoroseomonas wenyumeiae]
MPQRAVFLIIGLHAEDDLAARGLGEAGEQLTIQRQVEIIDRPDLARHQLLQAPGVRPDGRWVAAQLHGHLAQGFRTPVLDRQFRQCRNMVVPER